MLNVSNKALMKLISDSYCIEINVILTKLVILKLDACLFIPPSPNKYWLLMPNAFYFFVLVITCSAFTPEDKAG